MAPQHRKSRQTQPLHRPSLPLFLYDLGAASRLLPAVTVLPEQFYSRQSGANLANGAISLMRAVLEDAINCFQKQFITSGKRALRLAQEAEEWFSSDDTWWSFSFVSICSVLGLDPEYIRLGLKRWKKNYPGLRPPQKTRRAAPTGRLIKITV